MNKYSQEEAARWAQMARDNYDLLVQCRQFIERWVDVFQVTADEDPLAKAFVLSADAVYKMTYPKS